MLAQASCLQVDVLNNTILCIYRSPSNTNVDSFIDSLSSHLDTLASQKTIIIAGDININIRPKPVEQSYEHNNRTNYLNMLSVYGILPGHVLPTRVESCLDHFMLKFNKSKLLAFVAVLETTITDHFTTFLSLSKQKTTRIPVKTKIVIDYDSAIKYLQNKNLPK